MPKTIEEWAEHIAAVARDPARPRTEAAKYPDTPFMAALSGCTSADEKILLFARCKGTDALDAWIKLHRWDQTTLRKAADNLDRLGQGDLAALVRQVIPTIKAKVSDAIAAKRKAQRDSKRAFRKALAKARK
jgi:hypothetical protein